MTLSFKNLARLVFLASILVLTPAVGQDAADSRSPESSLDSLVLVLNLISSTHARPTTGVVLAGAGDGDQEENVALVLVSADFVGAGDEIIVLDGGNDLTRNGRETRTLARSAEAGLALLEVRSLRRPGVALSLDVQSANTASEFEFIAWPAADALVEGRALLRQSFGADDVSALPGVDGPVFDACGNLAGFHRASESGQLVPALAVADFVASWDVPVDQVSCTAGPASAVTGGDAPGDQVVTENPGSSNADQAPAPRSPEIMPEDKLSDLGLTPSQKAGLVVAWIVLGFLAMIHYRRRQRKKEGHFLVLQRHEGERRFEHRFRFVPAKSAGIHQQKPRLEATVERQGLTMVFSLGEQGLGIIAAGPEGSPERIELLVAGTPCLNGEHFLLSEGQEIRLGDEVFTVKLDSIGQVKNGAVR